MKKLFFTLAFALILTLSVCGAGVVDDADLLSPEEEATISDTLQKIYDSYSFDMVIVTVNSTNGKTIEAFADDYYDHNGYGYGAGFDGMIFVIDMSERNFTTSTCGSGIYLFSDYTIDNIHDGIIPYLSSGEYFTAFSEYIGLAEYVLYSEAMESSQSVPSYSEEYFPSDKYNEDLYTYSEPEKEASFYVYFEIGVVIVSLIIGFITVSVMKSGMKNIGIRKNADMYTSRGNLTLTRSVDRFMYSNVSKTRINTDSNNSSRPGSSFGGGHSTTRIGSSGRSHGGRSGSF